MSRKAQYEIMKNQLIHRGDPYDIFVAKKGSDLYMAKTVLKQLGDRQLEALREESEYLSKIEGCPQVVGWVAWYENTKHAMIILQLAEQTLESRLTSSKISLIDAVNIILDVLKALVFLHSKGITHGRLSTQTIFLTKKKAKVACFTEVCSSDYEAPRWAQISSDLWSVGCILYHMAFSQLYRPQQLTENRQNNVKLPVELQNMYPQDITQTIVDFLNKSLQVYPQHRKSAKQLLKHQIFQQNFSNSVLRHYSQLKPTVESALTRATRHPSSILKSTLKAIPQLQKLSAWQKQQIFTIQFILSSIDHYRLIERDQMRQKTSRWRCDLLHLAHYVCKMIIKSSNDKENQAIRTVSEKQKLLKTQKQYLKFNFNSMYPSVKVEDNLWPDRLPQLAQDIIKYCTSPVVLWILKPHQISGYFRLALRSQILLAIFARKINSAPALRDYLSQFSIEHLSAYPFSDYIDHLASNRLMKYINLNQSSNIIQTQQITKPSSSNN